MRLAKQIEEKKFLKEYSAKKAFELWARRKYEREQMAKQKQQDDAEKEIE